jgi:predicted GIY-YIG superfamily endonuclease
MGENHNITALQSRKKTQLEEQLSQALGDFYPREIPRSLRNDFMWACFKQIAPDRDPFEMVRTHENYTPSWSKKKQLATALRMLLTERVGHPEQDGITSLTKTVLAEILVAIRQKHDDTQPIESQQPREPPEREPVADPKFDSGCPVTDFDTCAVYEWIIEHRAPTDGEHGVYVLDCTPPEESRTDSRMESARRVASRKACHGHSLSKLERAAQAITQGKLLYYVGYTFDVPQRVRQHATGADAGGAKFTNRFTPQRLVEVSWYETEEVAREAESRRARELTVSGESFAYTE